MAELTPDNARYCIISPCRDEAATAARTLDCVTAQTVPPALWVIVDDGSTDGTSAILEDYAHRFPYIRIVRRADRGRRSVGPGVVDAFYEGYRAIDPRQFEFVCKLDLDLEILPNYFATLLSRMRAEPRLGACSGKPYYRHPRTGRLVTEGCGDEMCVGMIKFYRRACFEQIGGFVREVMWDGIDCHRCRMLGWIACSWDDPELRFIHLRPMGASQNGILTGRKRHGYGQWFMGTGPTYMTASAVFRLLHRPRIVGSLAMWWGYVTSMLSRRQRYPDRAFRRFVRRYQWSCLLRGKAAATRRLNDRQAAVWDPSALPASSS